MSLNEAKPAARLVSVKPLNFIVMELITLPQEALITRYLRRKRAGANEGTFVGVFETQQNAREGRLVVFELHRLEQEELDYFRTVPIDTPREKLFRIKTDKTRIANMCPLVKINFERGVVHFLQQREDEQVRFERGLKIQYMDISDDVYSHCQ